jgi:class III poly(R)-hydroxyalkanoic acid synthase PhaE subunit
MDQKQQEKTSQKNLMTDWSKSASDFWMSAAKMWLDSADVAETATSSKERGKERSQESREKMAKMEQAFFSAMTDPAIMDTALKEFNTFSEAALKMGQSGWDGSFHLQRQWLEKMGKVGESGEAYKFENLGQEAFKAWMETYERDLKPLLNMPQLGLTRFYQERMGQTADKFILFQTAVSEFLHLLSLPGEKSISIMQEKLMELNREGELSENSKDYYKMWIEILEGRYMALFQTPEYICALHNVVNTLNDFISAQEGMLTDGLQSLPIPTNKDMDELSKEIYLLKKKVKQLAKKMNEQDSNVQ